MRLLAVFLLLATPAMVEAQTPSTSPQPAAAAHLPQPASSSSETGAVTRALQLALEEHLYFALTFMLDHASGLTPEQNNFFQGEIAFHQGRFDDARQDLIAATNANPSSLSSNQKETALETLGENARLTSQYGACAQMYDDIERIWAAKLGPAEQNIKDKRHLCAVQQQVPPQTIDFTAPFTLQRHGAQYPVRVGNKDVLAILDTGASQSVITESTAEAWGIVPGDATVTMHGYSNGLFYAHPALIPELTIGTATLHDVAVLVAPDQDFYIASIKSQTNALLGYPVIAALGRLTFSRDGSLTVSPTSPPDAATEGSPLWLGDSMLLVELKTLPVTSHSFKMLAGNEPRLFVLDTGSRDSYLTDHYLRDHPEAFSGPPTDSAKLTGAGGTVDTPAYSANHLPLWCGPTVFFTTGPHVLTAPVSGEIENYEGLLGQATLRTFSSYTIDLRSMRFSIQP